MAAAPQAQITYMDSRDYNQIKFMLQEELLAQCPPLPGDVPTPSEGCPNPSWSGCHYKIASEKAKTPGIGYWFYGNTQIACSHDKWLNFTDKERAIVIHYGRVNIPGNKKVSLPQW